MKPVKFIEVNQPGNFSHVVKNNVPWQPEMDSLDVGVVFDAEFGKGGTVMTFEVMNMIKADGYVTTFFIRSVKG